MCRPVSRNAPRAFAFAGIFLTVCVASADDWGELTDEAYSPDRIARLSAQLDDEDPEDRVEAIHYLGRLGPEVRPAVPRIVELLADRQYEVYETRTMEFVVVYDAAQRELVAIGTESAAPLAAAFPGQSADVQARSVWIAHSLGPDARELLPLLIESYEQSGGESRSELLSAIAVVDPTGEMAVPLLIGALREDTDTHVRQTAAMYLNRTTPLPVYWGENAPATKWFVNGVLDPGPVAEVLRDALDDAAPSVRAYAAMSLASYPESAEQSIPLLARLFHDTDYFDVEYSNHVGGQVPIAGEIGRCLASFPDSADLSMPHLIAAGLEPSTKHLNLRHPIGELAPHCTQPNDFIRQLIDGGRTDLALLAIARLKIADAEVVQSVRELSMNENSLAAAVTLCCIDPEGSPDALNRVREEINESVDSTFGHSRVCSFITDVGANAEFAVPLLIDKLVDTDRQRLNNQIVEALAAIGPAAAAATPAVLDHIHSDVIFQKYYEKWLVDFGPQIVPLLIEALQDDSREPSQQVSHLRALNGFGTAGGDAVPAVITHLDSQYPRVRQAAVEALGKIAARAEDSLPALHRALVDPRPLVRSSAATSIAAFGMAARQSIPLLIDCLNDDYVNVQAAAIEALGTLGPAAMDAVPALEEFTAGDNYLLRDLASNAVAAIRGE